MSHSSSLIADMQSVYNTAPTAPTLALAIAAAGPITDFEGVVKLVVRKLEEAEALLGVIGQGIKSVTDASTDSTNLALINGIIAACAGTSSPSTSCIADIKSVISNGPAAATTAKAIAPAGEIMDYVANCNLVLLKLQEAEILLVALLVVTDGSDPNKTNITNVKNTLNGVA